jgi:zinc transport system substrate-binding protein
MQSVSFLRILLLLFIFTTLLFSKSHLIVSIAPQKLFVEKIAKEKASVTVMVQKGASPHNYQPKPSQMKEVAKADVYFAIGVEFEKVWLPKFQHQNHKMLIVDTTQGIKKHHNHHHHDSHEKEEDNASLDPHVWVDPINVKTLTKNIYETLIKVDANNSDFYKKNYEAYLVELDNLHSEIKEILKQTPKGAKFMVFHPSWGYFAARYHLTQLPVEIEGKEPKMKALIGIIKQAKKANVQAIFTQPEFSDKASKIIAKNLNIEVIKASPLAENWAENLKHLAKAIAKKRETHATHH